MSGSLNKLKGSYETINMLAKAKNINIIRAYHLANTIKSKYGLSIKGFLSLTFDNISNPQDEIKSYNDRIMTIVNLTGDAKSLAEKDYVLANQYTGVNIDDYISQKLYNIRIQKLIHKLARPTDDEILDKGAEIASKRLGISKEQAKEKITNICTEFNLPLTRVLGRGYYKFDNFHDIKHAIDNFPVRRDYADIIIRDKDCPYKTYQEASEYLDYMVKKFEITKENVMMKRYYTMTENQVRDDLRKIGKSGLKVMIKNANKAGLTVYEYAHKELLESFTVGDEISHYRMFDSFTLEPEIYESLLHNVDKHFLMAKYNLKAESVPYLLDKGKFNQFFKDYTGRKFWRNVPSATFADLDNLINSSIGQKIFIKPAKGSRGQGIISVNAADINSEELYNKLMGTDDTVVEQQIIQHPFMASYGGGCVNTLRIVTIYENSQVHFLYALFRTGIGDTFDNFSRGGTIAEVDIKTGIMKTDGFTKSGERRTNDVISGRPFKGSQLPNWDKVLETVTAAAALINEEGIGFVGWDIAITHNGAVLIEGNDNPQVGIIESIHADNGLGRRPSIKRFINEI